MYADNQRLEDIQEIDWRKKSLVGDKVINKIRLTDVPDFGNTPQGIYNKSDLYDREYNEKGGQHE